GRIPEPRPVRVRSASWCTSANDPQKPKIVPFLDIGNGDLIYGQGIGTVATLVERSSRFVMLVGLPTSHTADVVADALAAKIAELPAQLRRSLTWDQGKEMAAHSKFTVASGVPVFFCD